MNREKGPTYWESNVRELSRRRPGLVRRLKTTAPDPGLVVTASRSGPLVLVKRGTSLHSRHDPAIEAERFAASDEVREARLASDTAVIFGLGLGYHVRELARFFNRLVVFEPDAAVMAAALSLVDWRPLLPKLTFLTIGDRWPPDIPHKARLLVHRPTRRLHPAACDRVLSFAKGNRYGPGFAEPLKIMVVTPAGGGSLPVARHTIRALRSLGHRVVEVDTSDLDGGRQYGNPVHRVFDETGERAARTAETERPDLMLALAQAPLDGRALTRIRSLGVPTAFWFVEDFRVFGYFLELAAHYDFFFHIQPRDMAGELDALGLKRHDYLPLAADPDLFRPVADGDALSPYRSDLSFMGAGYPNRLSVFERLADYDFKIWGNGWNPDARVNRLVQEGGRRVSTEETVLIFNAARVNINLHSSKFTDGVDASGGFINPRTFEIASCGAFQIVDRRHPLELHFEPGKDLAVYDDPADLPGLVDYYLNKPDERRALGRHARRRVLAEHTYQHRMKTLLDRISHDSDRL